ncbi:MAG: DUF5683 domain-containing protein [Hyphomicrobiales bacterium]
MINSFSFRTITIVLLSSILFLSNYTFGQNQQPIKTDQETSLVVKKKHSPRKAVLLSAILPGAGQFYNKKYWKIPIIYALGGAAGYAISFSKNEYDRFRVAFNFKSQNKKGTPPNELVNKYSVEQLKQGKNIYQRDFQFNIILAGLLYALNIVDAAVDAHLFDYNVNDDLSLKLDPCINNNFNPNLYRFSNGGYIQPGLKLTIKLK